MKNKYTVITKSTYNIVEVQKVEAKNPEEAHTVAIQNIIDQMICDAGDINESDKQEVIDNEELICVLEGHCKCLWKSYKSLSERLFFLELSNQNF